MTIPMIPGIDPAIGQGLTQLADIIGQRIHPQYQFHQQLRAALAANPELVTQMGNLAARSPDAINQLFGSQVGQYFQKIGQTSEDLASQNTGRVHAEIAGEQSNAFASLTPDERKRQAQAGVTNALSGGQKPSDITTEQDTQRVQGAYHNWMQAHPNMTLQELIAGARNRPYNGQPAQAIPPDVFSGALQSPQGEAVSALMRDQLQQEEIAARDRMSQSNSAREYNRAVQDSHRTQAERFQIQTHTGTIDSWERVLTSPPNSQELATIQAKPETQRTPQENDLLNTQREFASLPEQDRQAISKPYITEYRNGLNVLRNIRAKESGQTLSDDMVAIAASINLASSRAGLGITATISPYVDRIGPFNKAPELIFKDSSGSTLTEDQVGTVLDRADAGNPSGGTNNNTSFNEQNVKTILDRVAAGTATTAQVAASTSLSPPDKVEALRRLSSNSTPRR